MSCATKIYWVKLKDKQYWVKLNTKNSIANVTNTINFMILFHNNKVSKHLFVLIKTLMSIFYGCEICCVLWHLLRTQMPYIRVFFFFHLGVGGLGKKVYPYSACNSHLEVSQNDQTALYEVPYTTSIPRDSFVLLRCHMSEQYPLVVCPNWVVQ